MGSFGGGKPDTSAAEESLRLQREETKRARAAAEEEKRTFTIYITSRILNHVLFFDCLESVSRTITNPIRIVKLKKL